MARDLFAVSWGNIVLWCSEISTDNSRTVVVHELATGDEHPSQDRGRAVQRSRCTLLFVEMPTVQGDPLDRFWDFKSAVDRGTEELFTHPIDGSYLAKVAQFEYVIDEHSNIATATCEFIASQAIVAVRPAATSNANAGASMATVAADNLEKAIAAVGIESTVASDAMALVDTWSDGETEVTSRDIINQTAQISDSLATFIALHGLEDDLALWDAYVGTINFGAAVNAAARSAMSETPTVFLMKVGTPTSVLALVVRIYPAAEAEERERQIRGLNDLRFVGGLIAAGTELVMPSPSTNTRAF